MWVFPAVSQSRGYRAGPGFPNFIRRLGLGRWLRSFMGDLWRLGFRVEDFVKVAG